MATQNFYLDRRSSRNGAHPLKIAVHTAKSTILIPTGVYLTPEQWDGRKVVGHPYRAKLNNHITELYLSVASRLLDLNRRGIGSMSGSEVKAYLTGEAPRGGRKVDERRLVLASVRRYAARFSSNTRLIYEGTARRLEKLVPDAESLTFEDVTVRWLEDFDMAMARTAPRRNARNIHFRNLRAVFNRAIDEGMTSNYPFRRFKIRPERTRHRSLPVEDLRELIGMDVDRYNGKWRDMFVLSLMLIGINFTDLYNLDGITAGRVEFRRAKTHRLYSIKVEPEALEIINRYRGRSKLLDLADTAKNPRELIKHVNAGLRKLGQTYDGERGARRGEARWPELTTYWARHTWATVAAALDIPKETIAAALGHGGNTVTDIYIDFDRAKVDAANRRVLDYVLYGKG